MKKTLLILFALIIGQLSFSQEILLTIDGNEISQAEFERIYLKNNQNSSSNQDIDEYLDLFINFKLKVIEAENLGYDTTQLFKTEFTQYSSQLSEPFFVDTAYQNQLLKQAYDRSKKEIRVRYIVIKSPQSEDTLNAYNKAMTAYNRIINGEDFIDVAIDVSESASVRKDSADGWFNRVFIMPYKLENFTYNGQIGDVSKPIFANQAYFIVKIIGYREVPKKVKASHVYISLPKNASEIDSLAAMKKIDSIQTAFSNGQSFASVAAQFSEDSYSSTNGGDIGWFSTGRMLRDFEIATFGIQNVGDSVGPIRTAVGYHFIKLTDKQEIGTFAEEKDELLDRMKNNQRYSLIEEHVFKQLMAEYNYQRVGNMNDFYTKVDSSIFQGRWSLIPFNDDQRILFTFANQEFTNYDFAKYLYDNQYVSNGVNLNSYIDNNYSKFVNQTLKNYELTQLPNKNIDYKYLMQEYHDGLLLFDITNDMVWNKAVTDTTGLRNFFNQNRNNYSEKVSIVVYSFASDKNFNKAAKKASKLSAKNTDISKIMKNIDKYGVADTSGIFQEGENVFADIVISKMQNNSITNDQNIIIDNDNKKIIIIKDNLPYIKGLVTADYQDILEKNWIAQLKNKYQVEINQDILNNIKANN